MLGKLFGLLCAVSAAAALLLGRTEIFGTAVLDGAGNAVTLVISLTGMMCLWCGIMEVFNEAGVTKRLSLLLRPVLMRIFPSVDSGRGLEEIAASVSANLLGIGNASTPLGIAAMKKLNEHSATPGIASDDMITFVTLNTASFSILPTTLIALRRAAGSEHPFAVVVPTWICSFAGTLFAILLCRAFAKRKQA